MVYYPFSAVIALFIAVMRNPRQPSAKTDLQLITATTRLFDKIYVRSDLSEKMNALTSRFQTEATSALERLNRKNQDKEAIEVVTAVASSNTAPSRNIHDSNASYVRMSHIPDHQGMQYIEIISRWTLIQELTRWKYRPAANKRFDLVVCMARPKSNSGGC